MIESLSANATEVTKIHATLGCLVANCWGYCAGGGMLANRKTVLQMENGVNRTMYKSLADEMFDSSYVDCGKHGDIATTDFVKKKRPAIEFVKWPAGYNALIWDFQEEQMNTTNRLDYNFTPITYHYPAKGRFPQVWKEIETHGTNRKYDL